MKRFRLPPIQITLGEADGKPVVPSRVQILRVGTFSDPRYGKFEITPDVLLSMKKNFDAKVRKIDLAIDYKHESEDVAAGWIKVVELSDDKKTLWAEVDWTPNGTKVLSDKEFRYLSADFNFEYQDNESGKKFGPTLFGAGLTNRPVIKGMDPAVELTEITDEGKDKMDELAKAQEQIKKLQAQIKLNEEACAGMSPEDMKKKLAELEEQLKAANGKLAEYEKKASEAAAAQKLAEKKASFDKLMSEGKVVEAQRQAFMDNDAVKLAELAGKVKLDNAGHGGGGSGDKGSAADQVVKLAEAKMEKDKLLSRGDAISKVLDENKELAKQYEQEQK